MTRVRLALFLMCAPALALAADDLRIPELETQVRDLQREVRSLSRQLDELRSQTSRTGNRPSLPSRSGTSATSAAVESSDAWVNAAKWQRLRPGMSELDVIEALGPPTSMRGDKAHRVLFYAMEIGSGFLGGNVTLSDGVVVEVRKPTLQ
jgi:hypothetical protein